MPSTTISTLARRPPKRLRRLSRSPTSLWRNRSRFRRDFRQRRSISQRAIDAFHDDQHVGTTPPKTSQALVEITDIVVAEPNDFCPAHPAAVINACVAIGIDKDHVSGSGERRNEAQIGNVPG